VPDFARYRLAWEPRLLSIVRIMAGLLFLEHGLAKIAGFPHQPTHAPFALFTLNPGLQGSLELVGGGLLVLGLFTRPVAFILSGDMAVAYFMAHSPRAFFPLLNGGELAIVYSFLFLYFWLAGGGVWSLDWLFAPAQVHVSAIGHEPAPEAWLVSRAPAASAPGRSAATTRGAARREPEPEYVEPGSDRPG
jgi:putative oxidoreductase